MRAEFERSIRLEVTSVLIADVRRGFVEKDVSASGLRRRATHLGAVRCRWKGTGLSPTSAEGNAAGWRLQDGGISMR